MGKQTAALSIYPYPPENNLAHYNRWSDTMVLHPNTHLERRKKTMIDLTDFDDDDDDMFGRSSSSSSSGKKRFFSQLENMQDQEEESPVKRPINMLKSANLSEEEESDQDSSGDELANLSFSTKSNANINVVWCAKCVYGSSCISEKVLHLARTTPLCLTLYIPMFASSVEKKGKGKDPPRPSHRT